METKEDTSVEHELDITETQAYADLVEACSDQIPEGAFTLKKFAEDTSLSESTAHRRLSERVEKGILDTKIALVDGYNQRIYWFT